jgi:hypothetical protein
MQIWVLRSSLYRFGNVIIISGTVHVDQYKVDCLLQVPWSLLKTAIFLIWLLEYTNQNHTSILQKALQLTNKIKKALRCVLVCQPAAVDRGTFRELPRKLPCDKDLQACWAEEKLHAQPEQYSSTLHI